MAWKNPEKSFHGVEVPDFPHGGGKAREVEQPKSDGGADVRPAGADSMDTVADGGLG
jgi:hypothetical protein